MIAARIHAVEPEAVSILATGERLERYRRDGFIVNGRKIELRAVAAPSGPCPDLIIVACKNHQLGHVIADLKPFVGADTLILSLLNGITSERDLGAAYGAERVPLAMIVGTDAGREGNRVEFTKPGTIYFGRERNGADRSLWAPEIESIARFLDRVGLPWSVPDDMLNRLWYKFMFNVGINQLTAVTRRPYSIVQSATAVSEARELMTAAMREAIEVARAEGVALSEADVESVYRTIDGISPDGKTSMCQDVEAGRKTEVELFSGTMIALAERHGIPVPVNRTLWLLIRTIERSY
jgi:2-dehydropantoate 2-reductase